MVGDTLRRERERQKLSVKDIEQGTSIRALYIEAIENGEYDKLPGTVYAKGFIKNYGNFLKIDGEALSRQFTEEISPPAPAVPSEEAAETISSRPPKEPQPRTKVPEVTASPVNEAAAIVNEPIPDINNTRQAEPEVKVNSPKLVNEHSNSNNGLIIAAIVLIAAIAGGLWYYFTNIEGKELAQNPPVQTQSDPSDPAATSAAASTPESSASITGINLQARFNDRCWTKVIVDNRLAYEGTVEAGQILNWQGNDKISVTAGNAGAVEFIENGRNLGIAGGVGEVVEKTFVRK